MSGVCVPMMPDSVTVEFSSRSMVVDSVTEIMLLADARGKPWFKVQGSGFRVQGSGFRVQGTGFRVQGSGFRVHLRDVPHVQGHHHLERESSLLTTYLSESTLSSR